MSIGSHKNRARRAIHVFAWVHAEDMADMITVEDQFLAHALSASRDDTLGMVLEQELLPLPDESPAGMDIAERRVWARQFLAHAVITLNIGAGFHPDTSFIDYVQTDGRHSFMPQQANQLNEHLRAAVEAVGEETVYQFLIELVAEASLPQ